MVLLFLVLVLHERFGFFEQQMRVHHLLILRLRPNGASTLRLCSGRSWTWLLICGSLRRSHDTDEWRTGCRRSHQGSQASRSKSMNASVNSTASKTRFRRPPQDRRI